MSRRYRITTDGVTVWVNGRRPIARFGADGIEINCPVTVGYYLFWTHTTPTARDWKTFKSELLKHHNIVVNDRYKPKRLRAGYVPPTPPSKKLIASCEAMYAMITGHRTLVCGTESKMRDGKLYASACTLSARYPIFKVSVPCRRVTPKKKREALVALYTKMRETLSSHLAQCSALLEQAPVVSE